MAVSSPFAFSFSGVGALTAATGVTGDSPNDARIAALHVENKKYEACVVQSLMFTQPYRKMVADLCGSQYRDAVNKMCYK